MKRALASAVLTLAVVPSSAQVKRVPASLTVQAGVVLKSGDVKRAARMELLLLNADFGALLIKKNDDIQEPDKRGLHPNFALQASWLELRINRYLLANPSAAAALGDSETLLKRAREYVAEHDAFLKRHTVSEATTDFDGVASFPAVAVGKYFLFGSFEFLKENVVWNVPVQLRPGLNRVVLDNQNAVPEK